jgi:Ca-activated chloride channel family protein
MTLTQPLLLVPGALLCAGLIVAAVVISRRRSAALAASGIAPAGSSRRTLGLCCSLAGVLVLAVGAAGPVASLPVGRSAGTVILAMDVSNSMAATDLTPSRLAAAQQAALAFIDAQPDTVDIGVVGFDQGALTTALPGADRAAAKAAVESLRIAGGTSLASAILGSVSAITGETVTVGEDGTLPRLGYWDRPPSCSSPTVRTPTPAPAAGATRSPTRRPSPRMRVSISRPSASAPLRGPPSRSTATRCTPRSTPTG